MEYEEEEFQAPMLYMCSVLVVSLDFIFILIVIGGK